MLVNASGPTENIGDWALTVSAARHVLSAWPNADVGLIPWTPQFEPAATAKALVAEMGPLARGASFTVFDPLTPLQAIRPFYLANPAQRLRIVAYTIKQVLTDELRLRFNGAARGRLRDPGSSVADRIRQSDAVVFVGGNIVCGAADMRRMVHLHRQLLPIRLAQKSNVPSFITGSSFDVNFNKLARWLALEPLLNASYVFAREPASFRKLSNAGVEKLSLTGDTAFCLTSRRRTDFDRNTVAVNTLSMPEWRAAVGDGPQSFKQALDRQIEILHRLLERHSGIRLLLIPHESASNEAVSDVRPLEQIASALGQDARVRIVPKIRSLDDIMGHYGSCALGIGPRYHGFIFGALAGTPMIGIGAKSVKIKGVASLLNLPYLPNVSSSPDVVLEQIDPLLNWDAAERQGLADRASQIGCTSVLSFQQITRQIMEMTCPQNLRPGFSGDGGVEERLAFEPPSST
jgi:polysaccharide pyruvyl transferase WcaK-like protein